MSNSNNSASAARGDHDALFVHERCAVAGAELRSVDGQRAARDLYPKSATGTRYMGHLVVSAKLCDVEIDVLMYDDRSIAAVTSSNQPQPAAFVIVRVRAFFVTRREALPLRNNPDL